MSADDNRSKPFYAYEGRNRPGDWQGPRRRTAREAALDYVAWANGRGVTPSHQNKRTGQKRSQREPLPRTPEVVAALGILADARGQQQGNQGYVYLIADGRPTLHGRSRFVKIGYSTKPEARVAELQAGNPNELFLVAYFPGTVGIEDALHQEFASDNVLQEWFRLSRRLWCRFLKWPGVTLPYGNVWWRDL